MDLKIKGIVKEVKREAEREEAFIRHRVSRAFDEIETLKIDFLNIDPDLRAMILFGSLAENRVKSIHFDIDIAVKSKKYYQLVGRALQSEFKVDVIDLETIHESIKMSIEKYGRLIYAMIVQKLFILPRNIKVQRPNILCWPSALRTSVADVIRRCPQGAELGKKIELAFSG